MSLTTSSCPLDCPDTCSLSIEVREQRVARIDGDHRNPVTAGFICGKVRKFADHMYGPERVRQPMLRTGPKGSGRFQPITWDEAMERICAEITRVRETHGGQAILPFHYGGCNGYLTDGTMDKRLFRRLGASRLLRTFCAATTGAAFSGLYGMMPGVSYDDYVHARLIVLWGVNPSATSIHLVPLIQRARESGARLVVVDPRAIPLARQADLHLPVRPGTDLPVALGIMNWLFENNAADIEFLRAHTTGWQTLRERAAAWSNERAAEVAGVSAEDLATLAAWYADAEPAVVRCGWGLERNRNGGSGVAAVLALPAVAGKFGVRGGGFTMSAGGGWDFDLEAAIAEPEPDTRVINMLRLGRVLLETKDPPIKLLFVYNANPVATAPRQREVLAGLAREDLFTVVFEQVHTDSANLADIILPATTFLEHHELRRSYGMPLAFDTPAVVPPVGEARANYQVFAELIERLELARPGDPTSPRELIDALVASSPHGAGIQAEIERTGMATRPNRAAPVPFVDIWPMTKDRKIHLCPDALEREAPEGLYAYRPDRATERHPLALISPAMSRQVSSTFGQLRRDPSALGMHPDDARARGIESGDRVRVFNELGEVECLARVSRAVRPGVVELAKGAWLRHTFSRTTANALIPDDLADLGGGACYNDARVQVERV